MLSQYIVVTVDATHRPVEFFHLHAGIADYFHHGGQLIFFTTYEIDKISCKHADWNFEPLDVRNMIQLWPTVSNEISYPKMQTEKAERSKR